MTFEQSSVPGSPAGASSSESQTTRRMVSLLIVLAVIGAPAIVLRLFCIGRSCEETTSVAATVPFCSLPDRVRAGIGAGFREGRSPDVLGVTRSATVVGGTARARESRTPWPSLASTDTAVPIVFTGGGIDPRNISGDAGLDDIAPTLAEILSYDRPHPEVRSGRALTDVTAPPDAPKLVLVVVWKGIGTADLQGRSSEWPNLAQLAANGAVTMSGDARSLPLDPAATLSTIGTGGLPSQHGITSRVVLNDEGDLVEAWAEDAPVSVIAALADDWDDARAQKPMIGLIATDPTDRGIVGGNWYVDADADRVDVVGPRKVLRAALDELRRGYGDDDVTDIVAVVDEGPIARLDSNLAWLSAAAQRASKDAFALVVTSTGSLTPAGDNVVAASDVTEDVEDAIPGTEPVVDAAAPGGLYLDQETLADEKISDDAVIAALEDARSGAGGRLMDQVFPALAVTFARYC